MRYDFDTIIEFQMKLFRSKSSAEVLKVSKFLNKLSSTLNRVDLFSAIFTIFSRENFLRRYFECIDIENKLVIV